MARQRAKTQPPGAMADIGAPGTGPSTLRRNHNQNQVLLSFMTRLPSRLGGAPPEPPKRSPVYQWWPMIMAVLAVLAAIILALLTGSH